MNRFAHAAQAVKHIDTSVHAVCRSIDDKRFGVLHPMRRLSVEMFREIFRHAVDDEYNGLIDQLSSAGVPDQKHLPTAAFTIAATCQSWRNIATAMPKLWQYICAPWTAKVQLNGRSVHATVGNARFKRCLALAGNTDLELTVRGPEHSSWKPILSQKGARKWSQINVVDPYNLPARFPCALRVWVCSTNKPKSGINLPTAALSSTYYLLCTSCFPRITTPIPGLHELDIRLPIGQIRCPSLSALLALMPALENLALECDHAVISSWVEDRTPRSHQSLRSLRIMTGFVLYLTSEFQFLTLPSLNNLEILDMDTSLSTESVTRMFAGPISIANTVTSLSIRCTESKSVGEHIRRFIGGLPKLTSLTLEQFAVVPGLGALLGTKTPDKLHNIRVREYKEGEKVDELINRLHSTSPGLRCSPQ